MEARQRNATESVNKLGPYETVELKWGRRLDGSYDTDPVESGQDYTLDVSFFNKNNAVYEINFTEINASTTITVGSNPPVGYSTTPKSAFTGGRYTLDPKEELPIRFKEFDFPDDWPCVGSQTFKVNATTEQKSGGWSDFGIAPSDEGDFRKFIHGFKPNINAEPGPLNIYVYTDPWGIDASEFPSTIAPEDRAEVIIKIQNKVKSGIAKIDDLYLVQEFEVPDNLFDILEGTCEGTKALTQGTNGNLTVDTTLPSGLCSSTWNNCLRFHFPNTLILKPNDKITISCEINLDPNILTTLTNEYTDQIRVFANFRYTQEWTNPIPCLTYV